jgi:hypothetical protein
MTLYAERESPRRGDWELERCAISVMRRQCTLKIKILVVFVHPNSQNAGHFPCEMCVLSVCVRETGWEKMAPVILAISIFQMISPRSGRAWTQEYKLGTVKNVQNTRSKQGNRSVLDSNARISRKPETISTKTQQAKQLGNVFERVTPAGNPHYNDIVRLEKKVINCTGSIVRPKYNH